MARIVTLADFVAELKSIGEQRFIARYLRKPALIGRDVVGELKPTPRGQTMHAHPAVGKLSDTALTNRIWLIESPRGKQVITVGRTDESDVVIAEFSLSREHCSFRVDDRGTFVSDRRSANGTSVNGVRIPSTSPYPLKDGDTVQLGRFEFVFYSGRGFIIYVARALDAAG